MGQKLFEDNIPAVVKNSNTVLTMAATNAGLPTRITIGGQQYKAPAAGISLSTATSGFNGIDTGSFTQHTIYNIFAVVSSGVLGMVISASTAPTGFTGYKFLGKLIAATGATISHVMQKGENFKEYVYNSGTWDATDTTNFGHGITGGAITGSLSGNRNKMVRFLVTASITDRYALELSVNGDSTHFYELGSAGEGTATAYVVQNGVEYGAQFDTFSGTDVTLKFLIYRRPSGSTYGSAGTAWVNGQRWRVVKISDVITGP